MDVALLRFSISICVIVGISIAVDSKDIRSLALVLPAVVDNLSIDGLREISMGTSPELHTATRP